MRLQRRILLGSFLFLLFGALFFWLFNLLLVRNELLSRLIDSLALFCLLLSDFRVLTLGATAGGWLQGILFFYLFIRGFIDFHFVVLNGLRYDHVA
jgi:hypothetical protein